jgi:UDP-N-acetyl-alpha-D-muramoyl-L-alanyl-L-glutamate epimerase
MPQTARRPVFDPSRYSTFRFVGWRFDEASATVLLSYALDDEVAFEERIELPAGAPPLDPNRAAALDGVLDLLHLVAGVSYYKAAAPPRLAVETGALSERRARFLTDVYVQGLGEYAYVNQVDVAQRVRFAGDPAVTPRSVAMAPTGRSLVPVGGGKDSVVALEAMRAAGADVTLFSVGDPTAIAATAAVAGLPRLIARRTIAPELLALNAAGALNGHVPVTAIVTLIALATAALHGHDEVVLANERSASQGNLEWNGIEVNHQWSKGLAFERALRDLLAREIATGLDCFSLLRGASELGIARAFAALPEYHHAFTSCNATFRIDERRRAATWCRDCPKCRFVFLALAPFMEPAALADVFGADLLDQPEQTAEFLALCGFEEHKPFECVGEREESVAAFRLLAADPRWAEHAVVRAARERLLPAVPADFGDPATVLALSGDHDVPDRLVGVVHARL